MVSWSVELSEFGIAYELRGPLTKPTKEWVLSVGGSSNIKGSGAGLVLKGLYGVLIEQSLHFRFKASNNEAEYEALVVRMMLAKEMGITELKVKSDSQLVTSQVKGTFQTKEPALIKYLEKIRGLIC